ncbi:hypothetical protein [Phenylobacterium sp.]|uniref:hypothetical protein n=1 Tax=Phenylobacterium sp. TaxID=1871053 RepID=UPI002FCC6AB1
MPSDKVFGVDRYELTARLRPAFLALLPAIALALVWIPAAWTIWGGVIGLLVTCGVTMMLSRFSRHRGRRVEAKYCDRLGSAVSMMALRHRDELIDPVTKRRYHEFLQRAGHEIPTITLETATPGIADTHYRGCVTWLLETTRDTKTYGLIFEENIDYGFRRNAFGLKVVAVPIAIFCAIGNVAITYATWTGFDATAWKAIGVGLVCLVALTMWTFVVNLRFVEDAARSYAVRLLAACDKLKAVRSPKAPRRRSTLAKVGN